MPGRIRTIKPEWLEDELMVMASSDARVMSIAMILLADDYGNGRCHQPSLAARVFPPSGDSTEDLKRSSRRLQDSLDELVKIRFIGIYKLNGQSYFAIRNWDKHQKVQHPSKPLVSGPPESIWTLSGESQESLTPDHDHDHDHDHETRKAPASRVKAKLAPKFEMTPDWEPTPARLDAVSARTGVPLESLKRCVPEFRLYWLPGGKGYDRNDRAKRQIDWDTAYSHEVDYLIRNNKIHMVSSKSGPSKPMLVDLPGF